MTDTGEGAASPSHLEARDAVRPRVPRRGRPGDPAARDRGSAAALLDPRPLLRVAPRRALPRSGRAVAWRGVARRAQARQPVHHRAGRRGRMVPPAPGSATRSGAACSPFTAPRTPSSCTGEPAVLHGARARARGDPARARVRRHPPRGRDRGGAPAAVPGPRGRSQRARRLAPAPAHGGHGQLSGPVAGPRLAAGAPQPARRPYAVAGACRGAPGRGRLFDEALRDALHGVVDVLWSYAWTVAADAERMLESSESAIRRVPQDWYALRGHAENRRAAALGMAAAPTRPAPG